MLAKNVQVLPGFRLTMGFSLAYLSLIVLLPMGALLLKTCGIGWAQFWKMATMDRALAAYKLTFGASLAAAAINAVFGSVLAWVLVRYHFPGRKFVDALVDIPFALPTAVAGITLANLFAPKGWLGQILTPLGIEGAYSALGIVIALTFVSLPFVVRTLQPVLANLDRDIEEAAATLGASRLRCFFSILLPTLFPTIVTGFTLSFARAIGEYGSVIFISSNALGKLEIVPLVIITLLEEFEYPGAMAVAVVMLIASFLLLGIINWLEAWSRRYQA